jgi:hypothetical protein
VAGQGQFAEERASEAEAERGFVEPWAAGAGIVDDEPEVVGEVKSVWPRLRVGSTCHHMPPTRYVSR